MKKENTNTVLPKEDFRKLSKKQQTREKTRYF